MSAVSLKAEALLIFYKTQPSGFMQVLGPEDPRNGSAVSSLHVLKPATHPLCAFISSFVEDKNIFHRPHLATMQVEFTLCILQMRNLRLREVRQPALYHTAPGSGKLCLAPVWPPGLAELGPLQDAIPPGLLKIKNRLPFGGIGVRWEERGSQRREVGNSARNHTITYTPGPHTHLLGR